jgi:ADP-ribose pyrophosphatase
MPSITARSKQFSTPWFEIIAKTVVGLPGAPNGEQYYALETTDYVTVLPVTEAGEFVLVRQFRPAVEGYTLELPSGNVDTGEEPESAARRELLEETGHQAKSMDLLGCLHPDSGRLANRLWCFIASVSDHQEDRPLADSQIEVLRCGAKALRSRIADGSFNHAPHLGIVLLAILQGKFPFEPLEAWIR